MMRDQESQLFNTFTKNTILSSNMPIGLLSKLGVTQNLFICPWRYYALSLLLFVVKNASTHDFDNEGFLFQLQVCKIVEGQRYTEKLNEIQVSFMLRATCQRPNVREENIVSV